MNSRGRRTRPVEESEADLDRFDKWLSKIKARDYFNAPGAAAADEAVEQCRTALTAFEDAALDAQTGHPTTDTAQLPTIVRLRAVD